MILYPQKNLQEHLIEPVQQLVAYIGFTSKKLWKDSDMKWNEVRFKKLFTKLGNIVKATPLPPTQTKIKIYW